MKSPIEEAKTITPFWMMDINMYDAVEIHPVRDIGKDECYRGQIPEGDTWHEVCEPHEGDIWSVYGHLKTGGLECFEDFKTEAEAESFAEQLRGAYPHLRGKEAAEEEIVLFAQPYDISASGFYFKTLEEYQEKSSTIRNDCGLPVEEFEVQFINGEEIDADLFRALNIHQGNFNAFLTVCADWDEEQKIKAIIAVGECGYRFDIHKDDPDDFDVDLYRMENLRELAYHFVEEGLFGDIPENIQNYLDYDAIARDLGIDYIEISIAGKDYIYRCI